MNICYKIILLLTFFMSSCFHANPNQFFNIITSCRNYTYQPIHWILPLQFFMFTLSYSLSPYMGLTLGEIMVTMILVERIDTISSKSNNNSYQQCCYNNDGNHNCRYAIHHIYAEILDILENDDDNKIKIDSLESPCYL